MSCTSARDARIKPGSVQLGVFPKATWLTVISLSPRDEFSVEVAALVLASMTRG